MSDSEVDTKVSRQLDPFIIQNLQSKIRGEVLSPTSSNYDFARKVFNADINRYPSLIIQCVNSLDVIKAIEFAHNQDLSVAIRGSGHNIAGTAVCDNGIVIDLSKMRHLHIVPKTRRIFAEPGVTWGEFDKAAQLYNLATPGGTVTTTGIAGLTLGGGMGWLLGKHGLTCDNLISARIVTAEGQHIAADAQTHADLFWALKGGGGNFGVVTSFEYQLHYLYSVIGGTIIYSIEKAKDVFQLYHSFTSNASDDLTASFSLLTTSEGIPAVTIDLCYLGSDLQWQGLLKMLELPGKPLKKLIFRRSYCDLQAMYDKYFTPDNCGYWKSSFLPEINENTIEALIEHFRSAPSSRSMILIDHLHGAMQRVNEAATAFGNRNAPYSLLIAAIWSDRTAANQNKQWARVLFERLDSSLTHGVYTNYLGQEGQNRVKAAYGATKYHKLMRIKQQYDPTNFFHHNQNIVPIPLENLAEESDY